MNTILDLLTIVAFLAAAGIFVGAALFGIWVLIQAWHDRHSGK